ncbi:MAG TPA: sigma-70 family RNA polymerase sigma factor [Candidatus Angelobacter sp.]|jgi:DNA-directed RNA polymerase specialized sigma24 family protein|nr:sigma-70 family RNA polymerase sigma factor [Candidatus Angelobacter sp.]
MSVIQHLWRGRRVRVAGAVEQVAVQRPEDMAAIYQEYRGLVYRRCLGTLGDEQAAEDATQDVFVAGLANFEQVQHDVVRGLLDIARTISYERNRRPAREVSLADPAQHRNGHSHDDPAEIAERHGELDEVWSGLSPVERRYVADKFAGFSFEEIAQRNRRKLGTVSSNLFRAREHARSLRGPTLPALLGAAGWRRLTGFAHRARNAAHSASTTAAAQPIQTLTLSLTLAGLLAGASPAMGLASPSPSDPAAPTGVVPPTQLPIGAPAPVAAAVPLPGSGHGASYTAATPRPAAAGAASGLPLVSSASSETPEDTVIYTAAPSPNYDSDHTILAIGRGKTCACSVLLRSTDGGATWTASSGVPDGDQLVLPPAYPTDPRIFVGYQNEAPGATNWWAPSFASSFLPLPGPAGALALPAGFDSGDQRVIVSSASGVWSDDLISQVVRPLVVDPSGSGTRAVATPLGAMGTGVFAMTSTQAVTPGTIANAVATPGGLALWACPPSGPCEERATVPIAAPATLSLSPTFERDQTIAAAARDHAELSRDGGNTFVTLDAPRGTSGIVSLALGRLRTDSVPLWMVVQHGNAYALEFSPTSDGSWHEVGYGMPQITGGPGRVVVLGTSSVMYLSNAGGLLCTTDDGKTWATRCPAA